MARTLDPPAAAQFFSLTLDLLSVSGRFGYFQRVTPAFVRAFGYTEAELLDQPFIVFVHPDDRSATLDELEKLAHGQPTPGFEHRFRARDGGFRWLSWTAVATPEHLVYAVARDVTERRQLAQRDGFLISVSHDLQQPLTVIKGQAQVMQRRLARGEAVEPPRLEQCLAYINAAVNRMHAMIQELLDAALQESGQPLALVLTPTDLVALVRQTVTEHQFAFDAYRFELDARPRSLVAMLDGARIQRVLGNLLSNAIKYSPGGGPIRVRISEVPSPTGTLAEIVVQDEGIGIPGDDLPRIFDRFHRGSNVVRRIGGTGLGLAGVRQMVALHGGSISVDSEEGHGSTFTLCIPVRAARAPA
ncbi:MAG TPA: PAS domain-containing sensor histidine kinase [Chloroflexota bacterium]|nr:PAS domain-containing sensor histidine kinase [Chloroflexota bacterium]